MIQGSYSQSRLLAEASMYGYSGYDPIRLTYKTVSSFRRFKESLFSELWPYLIWLLALTQDKREFSSLRQRKCLYCELLLLPFKADCWSISDRATYFYQSQKFQEVEVFSHHASLRSAIDITICLPGFKKKCITITRMRSFLK